MKNVKLLLLLGFVGMLTWTSCKKGDTGPAGATGPAGPDSVMYSAWISLTFSYNAVTDSTGYFTDTLAAPAITQGILDSGVVLGYVDGSANNDGTAIIPVSGAENLGFAETYELGKIVVYDLTTTDYSSFRYRYVVIPGSKIATNGTVRKYNGYTISELKSMSYDKLKAVTAPGN